MAQEKEIKNFVFNYTDGTSDIKFRNGRRIWKRPDTNCSGLRRVGRAPGNVRQKGK